MVFPRPFSHSLSPSFPPPPPPSFSHPYHLLLSFLMAEEVFLHLPGSHERRRMYLTRKDGRRRSKTQRQFRKRERKKYISPTRPVPLLRSRCESGEKSAHFVQPRRRRRRRDKLFSPFSLLHFFSCSLSLLGSSS